MSLAMYKELDTIFIASRTALLKAVMRLVANKAIAEELTQESYLLVRNSLSEQRQIEHLRPFLFQTARNLGLDYLRAVKRQSRFMVISDQDSDDILESSVCESSAPDVIVAGRRSIESLSDTLQALSERQQQVFILNRLNGWSHARIAEHLAVSESTVQKEVKLVMALCIKHFQNHN